MCVISIVQKLEKDAFKYMSKQGLSSHPSSTKHKLMADQVSSNVPRARKDLVPFSGPDYLKNDLASMSRLCGPMSTFNVENWKKLTLSRWEILFVTSLEHLTTASLRLQSEDSGRLTIPCGTSSHERTVEKSAAGS